MIASHEPGTRASLLGGTRQELFESLKRRARPLPRAVAGPRGGWRELSGEGVVLSAPHEVAHVRDGRPKQAEAGTAGLAFSIARTVGAAAICTSEPQSGDPNWDESHPYLERVIDLANGGIVIDLHMMQPRGVDMCIGLGPFPERVSPIASAFLGEAMDAGLDVGVNWPFAARQVALAAQLQRRGAVAVQLELSYDCFDASKSVTFAAWTAVALAVEQIMRRRTA